MNRRLALLALLPFLQGYLPGDGARDVDSQIATFITECAAGEDANTNVYDALADWTDARLNDSAKQYHCVEAGDYEGHNDVIIDQSGADEDNMRVYGFYDPDLTGDARQCGDGNFYETPGWGLRANGFAGAESNGAFAQGARAIFEKLDVRADNIIVHCLTFTDPDLDGPAGPLLNVRGADMVVIQHSYFHDPSQQVLLRMQRNNSNIFVQYNVIECEQTAGTRRLGISVIFDNASGDAQNVAVTSNESYDCADAFQILEQAADPDNATDYAYGIYVENNDFYATSQMYIDCGTGAFDPGGDCSCTENAIDIKIGNQDGTTPREIGATAWAATTAYSVGDVRRPTTRDGFAYIVVSAGTSGGSEPTWNNRWKRDTTDGTVTWRAFFDRLEIRGNYFAGFQHIPALANTNCPNLSSSAAPAIGIHKTHGDYGLIADNVFADMVNGIWFSDNGPDRWTISNNVFSNVAPTNCDGESTCLETGVVGIAQGDGVEVYHNLIVGSDTRWLDTSHSGNNAEDADVRGNLMIDSDVSAYGTLGTGSNVSHNANIGTATTTNIGTNEQLDDGGLSTWAVSTAYSAGDLVLTPAVAGLMVEAQGACTSNSTEPTWNETIDGSTTDNTCSWTTVRKSARMMWKRWTGPALKTIPYAVGGASASPVSAFPGDVDQGCQANTGVANNVPTGVTCP